jgi:hypothetical protein
MKLSGLQIGIVLGCSFFINDKDFVFHMVFLLFNGVDGKKALGIGFMAVDVVCAGFSTSDVLISDLGVRSLIKIPGNLQYDILLERMSAKFVKRLIIRKIVVGSIILFNN